MSTCTQWVDKGVIECKQWADRWTRRCQDWADSVRRVCDEWKDEGYQACDRYEDQGYDSCSSWSETCSDWLPWPLSYLCDAFEWVCDAWVWISHWVCVAFVWISSWVCKAWAYIVEWVCVAWFWLIEAFCTVWSWVAKLVCIAWDKTRCALVALGEVVASLFGRRPRRRRRIRHVFVLMLENRSFDHMFGFSDIRGTDSITGQPTQIDNLIGNPQSNIDPATGNPVFAAQPADFALSGDVGDPGHEFHDILEQLAGSGAVWPSGGTPTYPPIDNSGYVANFRGRGSPSPEKAMHGYAPDQLPILNTLAREFAVCDHWFSSMPGPTWPNRLFVHAASSAGLDDSPGTWDTVTTTLIDGYRFDNGNLYDRLEDKCLDWLVFEGDETPQVFSLSGMNFNALQGRFRDFEDFRDSVNDKLFPASYTFIEPNYGNIMPWTPEDFTCGNSQHPLDDVTRGERLIKDVYEAVRNSPHWESSADHRDPRRARRLLRPRRAAACRASGRQHHRQREQPQRLRLRAGRRTRAGRGDFALDRERNDRPRCVRSQLRHQNRRGTVLAEFADRPRPCSQQLRASAVAGHAAHRCANATATRGRVRLALHQRRTGFRHWQHDWRTHQSRAVGSRAARERGDEEGTAVTQAGGGDPRLRTRGAATLSERGTDQ